MLHVFLLDPRPLMLLGLRTLLESVPDMTLLNTRQVRYDLDDPIQFVSTHLPDVLIASTHFIDVQLQEILQALASVCPLMSILLLVESYHILKRDTYWTMATLGVKGILASDEPVEEWLDAIYAAGSGRLWFSAKFPVGRLLQGTASDNLHIRLTRREADVSKLVLAGLSNREIAAQLAIAERTVESHLSNLMQKFQAPSRVKLVLALQQSDLFAGQYPVIAP
jgi:DNA-binding NarL/FixJ family response regulator